MWVGPTVKQDLLLFCQQLSYDWYSLLHFTYSLMCVFLSPAQNLDFFFFFLPLSLLDHSWVSLLLMVPSSGCQSKSFGWLVWLVAIVRLILKTAIVVAEFESSCCWTTGWLIKMQFHKWFLEPQKLPLCECHHSPSTTQQSPTRNTLTGQITQDHATHRAAAQTNLDVTISWCTWYKWV